MKNLSVKKIAMAGIIAAVYTVMTIALQAISFGPIQVRISEALTILPLFYPESIIGLTIGCFISNLLGNGVIDMALGTAATMIASIITYIIGRYIHNKHLKFILGGIPPVIINALVVPIIMILTSSSIYGYWLEFILIFAGQSVSVYGIGAILYYTIIRRMGKKKDERMDC